MRQNIGMRFAFALSAPREVFSSVIRVADSESVVVPTLAGPPLKRAYSLRLRVDICPLETLSRQAFAGEATCGAVARKAPYISSMAGI
jgi:hypothetical protein